MENKCLVCGAIIPESRQVCPNCEKGGKHEISKKLTDEQIDLETYLNSFEEGDNITVTCDLLNAMEQALALIHRLQSENERMKDTISEMRWNINDQKEEIERLTDTLNQYINGELINAETMGKIIFLEKQVDELKEKIMNLKSAMIDRVARKSYDSLLTMPEDVEEIFGDAYESEFNKFLQQAVKDTAKEIYEILEKWDWKLKNEKGSLGYFRFAIETAMQEIKEKYSLEVANFKLVELKKGERK